LFLPLIFAVTPSTIIDEYGGTDTPIQGLNTLLHSRSSIKNIRPFSNSKLQGRGVSNVSTRTVKIRFFENVFLCFYISTSDESHEVN